MSSCKSRGSSAARSKASVFSLDYAYSLSVRKVKGSGKARSSGRQSQSTRGREE